MLNHNDFRMIFGIEERTPEEEEKLHLARVRTAIAELQLEKAKTQLAKARKEERRADPPTKTDIALAVIIGIATLECITSILMLIFL